MTNRRAAPPTHPLAEGIDWDVVSQEAAQTLSEYVKLDSSHPVGRTVETARLLADRLAAEDRKGFHGLDERLSIENLLLGTKILHDLTLRAAARRSASPEAHA